MPKETIFYILSLVGLVILLWLVGASFYPLKILYNFLVHHMKVIPFILALFSPVLYGMGSRKGAWILLGIAIAGFIISGTIPLHVR